MKKLLTLLLTLLCSASMWAGDKYPDILYAIGNATNVDWNVGNAIAIYKTTEKKYQGFVYFDNQDGELKFLTEKEYNKGQWGAETNGTQITSSDPIKLVHTNSGDGETDKKYIFQLETGLYLVSIDVTTVGSETVKIEKWDNSKPYEIATLGGLKAFADGVNMYNTSINAKLTANIEGGMDYSIGWYNDDNSKQLYSGTFDGQGHSVTMAIGESSRNSSDHGLFGAVAGGTIIRNVVVKGYVDGQNHVGGVVGAIYANKAETLLIENCGNEAVITSYGGVNAAGILAVNMFSNASVTIRNCYNTGNITGEHFNGEYSHGDVASISGWIGDLELEGKSCYATNCYNIGEVKVRNTDNDEYTIYNDFIRNNGCGVAETHITNTYNKPDGVDTGELCYKLNGSKSGGTDWYQNLKNDKDNHPVPFSTHAQVYKWSGIYNNTSDLKIRFQGSWDGRNMHKANDYTESNRHYQYKGFIPTNRAEGTFINFKNEDTFWGPSVVKDPDDLVHIHTVNNGQTYNDLTNKSDNYGYIFTTGSSDKRGAMLDVDVVFSDEEGAKVTISAIESPKLLVVGDLEGRRWNKDTDGDAIYLTETAPNSLIYKGIVNVSDQSNGEITFFAPRYNDDWYEERIGPKGNVTKITAPNINEWSIDGFAQHADKSFTGITKGKYIMTVDLLNKRFMYEDVLDGTITAQDGDWYSYGSSNAFKVPAGIAAYTGSIEGTTITLTEVAEGTTIAGGQGIVFKCSEATSQDPVSVNFMKSLNTAPEQENQFKGSSSAVAVNQEVNDYYIVASTNENGTGFYHYTGTRELKANRAYIELQKSAGAPAFLGFFEDEETAISDTKVASNTATMFDLMGRRVQKGYKGIVISEGKKYLMK